METKDIILELRIKRGMSQEELAEKVFVTRQAVSRWENGETTPNTETLKLLSKLFDVSINTLLGSPRQLVCQCCGMPLEDSNTSRETDGFFNEEYCKWCYADGEYMYHDMDELIEVCVKNMTSEHFSSQQAREYMKDMLPKLDYWKHYKNLDGAEKFEQFKQQLISEFNELRIEGMPKVEKLNALVGGYINLEYQLPNGQRVKFLDDNATYLGNQLESEFGGSRCFGVAANMDFLLVCTYEENGENPELVVYKKR
ncbi:MAG: helix-turn-helix domain-containing protein [Ruminococcaceae bacterium]|nr:helix-turn-helix domain-containing protein [Oscillospiraceae bacterium]